MCRVIGPTGKTLILVKPEERLSGVKPSAAGRIGEAVKNAENYAPGAPEMVWAKNMEEAVAAARSQARAGDIVSLCPACTGFDMYPNFEVRGNHYKEIVMGMK